MLDQFQSKTLASYSETLVNLGLLKVLAGHEALQLQELLSTWFGHAQTSRHPIRIQHLETSEQEQKVVLL